MTDEVNTFCDCVRAIRELTNYSGMALHCRTLRLNTIEYVRSLVTDNLKLRIEALQRNISSTRNNADYNSLVIEWEDELKRLKRELEAHELVV